MCLWLQVVPKSLDPTGSEGPRRILGSSHRRTLNPPSAHLWLVSSISQSELTLLKAYAIRVVGSVTKNLLFFHVMGEGVRLVPWGSTAAGVQLPLLLRISGAGDPRFSLIPDLGVSDFVPWQNSAQETGKECVVVVECSAPGKTLFRTSGA